LNWKQFSSSKNYRQIKEKSVLVENIVSEGSKTAIDWKNITSFFRLRALYALADHSVVVDKVKQA